MKGKFITVEGVEGAGKTTQLGFITDFLETAGRRVVLTREPGGSPLSEELRALLLGHRHDMATDTELLLLFAARAEHIEKVISPALQAGDWVLCDRFTDATYAYQGGGRGVPWRRIAALEEWVQGELRPDLTLLLDVSVDQGLARVGQRGQKDRIECEGAAFFQRVRNAYLDLAARFPERYRLIDASYPVAVVSAKVAQVLTEWLD